MMRVRTRSRSSWAAPSPSTVRLAILKPQADGRTTQWSAGHVVVSASAGHSRTALKAMRSLTGVGVELRVSTQERLAKHLPGVSV